MTKIDLITGILGAGKTTFLHGYAEYCLAKGEKIAILENDFGAVNVDRIMLNDLQNEHCQVEVIAGGGDKDCHQRRFKTQLISLGMQHVDRVIVEPSGIFDMDEFFDILFESPLDKWYTIGSVLTIIDSGMPERLSFQNEYLLASQAACAGKLIFSKIKPETNFSSVLEHVNRALSGIQCPRRFTENMLFVKLWNELNEEDYAELSSAGYRNERYVRQFNIENSDSEVHYFLHVALPEERIQEILTNILQDEECGEIFRIKGALPKRSGNYLKINAVRKQIEISSIPEAQAVLIVIGKKLNFPKIDQYFRKENTNPKFTSI